MSTPDMTPSDTNPSDTNPQLSQPVSLEGLLATYTAWQGRNVLHEAAHRAETAGEADRAAALRALAARPAEQQAPGALEALSAQHKISSLLAGWRWHTVTAARETGATWSEIAAATGTDAEQARADYVDHIERQARWGYAGDRDLARYRTVAEPDHQPTLTDSDAVGTGGGTGGEEDAERFARAEQAVREAEARVERLAHADVFTGVTPVREPEWDQDGPTSADLEQWAEVLTSWADQGEQLAPAARADYHRHDTTASAEPGVVADPAGESGAPAREPSELEDTVLWWVGQQGMAEEEAEFHAALDEVVADDHPQREVVIERAVALARDRFTTHGESLTVEDALGLDTAHILRNALADADHDAVGSDAADSDTAGTREGGDGALGALSSAELLARAEQADNLTYVGSLAEVAAAHDELDALRTETVRRAQSGAQNRAATGDGADARAGLAAYVALLADDPGLKRVEEFTRLHRQVHHDLDVPAQSGIHRPAGHDVLDPAHTEGRGVGEVAAGIDAQMRAELDFEDGWTFDDDAARWSPLLDPTRHAELGTGEARVSGTAPLNSAVPDAADRSPLAAGSEHDGAGPVGFAATEQIMDEIAARTADPTAGYDPSAEWGEPGYREPRSDAEAAARTAHVNYHWPVSGWVPRPASPVEDALEVAQERAVLAEAAHDPDPDAWAEVERLEALADLRPTDTAPAPAAQADDDARWERNGYAATWSAAAAERDGAAPPDSVEVRRLVDAARARLAGHTATDAVVDEGRRAQLSVWARDQHDNDHLAHDAHDAHGDDAGYDGSDGDGEGRW